MAISLRRGGSDALEAQVLAELLREVSHFGAAQEHVERAAERGARAPTAGRSPSPAARGVSASRVSGAKRPPRRSSSRGAWAAAAGGDEEQCGGNQRWPGHDASFSVAVPIRSSYQLAAAASAAASRRRFRPLGAACDAPAMLDDAPSSPGSSSHDRISPVAGSSRYRRPWSPHTGRRPGGSRRTKSEPSEAGAPRTRHLVARSMPTTVPSRPTQDRVGSGHGDASTSTWGSAPHPGSVARGCRTPRAAPSRARRARRYVLGAAPTPRLGRSRGASLTARGAPPRCWRLAQSAWAPPCGRGAVARRSSRRRHPAPLPRGRAVRAVRLALSHTRSVARARHHRTRGPTPACGCSSLSLHGVSTPCGRRCCLRSSQQPQAPTPRRSLAGAPCAP